MTKHSSKTIIDIIELKESYLPHSGHVLVSHLHQVNNRAKEVHNQLKPGKKILILLHHPLYPARLSPICR